MLYTPTPDTLYHPPPHHVDPLGYSRLAIITGCSSGIGLATTQLFLAHQFQVVGLDISPFDYNLLRVEDHGRFHFHLGDLTQPGQIEQGIQIANHFGGRIDVLINVAGVLDNFASADGVTDADWDRVLATNLTVPVKMMRAVIPHLKQRPEGGVIINVASTAGKSGAVAGVAYTASKHGLIGATKNVAWRFRNEGIRANAVLPGAVDSSVGNRIAEQKKGEGGVDLEGYKAVEPVHALQAKAMETAAPITALEVAKTILFLASDQARTINGVELPVDRAWGVV
ncbi:putative reductase [Triangularia verruculosa]|uniref:Reductase n=1 Tax=Triangularia verruculosa TaxID=2587418 RepID=A0AAN6XL88_9PEZI|nr:putative reductase [Triangularia verruculosa]